MADNKYILALDQGTTSSRAIIFDHSGKILAQNNQEFEQIYPRPGWVEHNPEDIWSSQINVAKKVMADTKLQASDFAAIGITNQRETTVVWDRTTGRAIHNAIVWQDRRTAGFCDELKSKGWTDRIREKTGLVIDAYFSGTKVKWLLDNVEGAREKAERGELLFGNIDTFLIWRLTEGKVYVTDYSNASRTMLFNIRDLTWDKEILAEFNIPESMLPQALPSSHVYGNTVASILGGEIPIAGDAGDQQAATFGQACFEPGMAKNTYGTGCFMLMNTGETAVPSKNNLLTTIGWGLNGKVTYCLEGSVFITGAAVQYLRDSLGIITNASETESIANSVESSGGVYVVPAFVGLGAPYWDQYARGAIMGLTRGSGRAEITRATLEAVAYQSRELLEAMVADSGVDLKELRVDGGMVANNFLMQFQADILDVPVERPVVAETTALGAAYLAGLAVGYWKDTDEVKQNWALDRKFTPNMEEATRAKLYKGWKRAVQRTLQWEEPGED
ncbi:MAG: glycerol kinase GlpK [Chloroflexota bacterium]|nr:glycerol kinase GlpK [Chloroflexota bacterium]